MSRKSKYSYEKKLWAVEQYLNGNMSAVEIVKQLLSNKVFCVYLDATYLPLHRQTFEREAVYIAIGIKPNGHKKVIDDYCIAPNENIEVWTEMLQNMKSRGLKQVELFLSDGVVGMKQALVEAYPKAHFQRCLVLLCATFVPKFV